MFLASSMSWYLKSKFKLTFNIFHTYQIFQNHNIMASSTYSSLSALLLLTTSLLSSMYDRKYFCNHQILHHKAVLSKCISVITNCKFVKTLPLFDRRVYNFVPSSRFRFQCSAVLSAVWMKCGYLPKKCFASDIFCAGAKFNVTLSIMTSNSDVFLSLSSVLMMLSSCVSCLSISHKLSLYCYV